MKQTKKNHRNLIATALALMLAAGLVAVTTPAGQLAAATSALAAYSDASADEYQTPDTPAVPDTPPDDASDEVYGGNAGTAGGGTGGSGSPTLVLAATDTTPPVLSGFIPADGSLIGPAATFGASFVDPAPSDGIAPSTVMIHIDNRHQYGCTITDSSISCNKSGLSDGPHRVQAYACDIDYNCSSSTWNITVDAIAPAISGNQPTGTLNSTSATLTAAFSDAVAGVDPASAAVTLDGAAVSGCAAAATGVSCPVTSLAEGSHAVSVDISDRVGNHATQTWTFTVDTAAVGVSGQSPAAGSWQTSASPTISVAFIKAGTGEVDPASINLYIDGADVSAGADCQSTGLSYTPLSPQLEDGWHTVSVTVRDSAGHDGSSSWSFGVDTAPPAITGASPTGTAAASPTISAAFSDSGSGIATQTAAITLDGEDNTSGATISADGISFVPAEALAAGSHSVQFSISDSAGNEQTAVWGFTSVAAPQTPVTPVTPVSVATAGTLPSMVEVWLDGGSVAGFGGGAWSISGFLASANAYYLPWYESGEALGRAADEIVIKNTGAGEAVVNLFVAGERRWEGKVAEGGSATASVPNVTGGPVKIVCPSGQPLEVTHNIKNPDGKVAGAAGIAEESLEAELLLPRYEAPAAGQGSSHLVIANAGGQEAAVDVYVGDPGAPESLKGHYTIAANAAARSDLPDVNGGPVRIICTNGQPLVAGIETVRPVKGQDIRQEIIATGVTRLENRTVNTRDAADSDANMPKNLYLANPNDRDLEVELKIAGETVDLGEQPDEALPLIPRQSLKQIDLSGLPAGPIEIVCQECGLGEGLLGELSR